MNQKAYKNLETNLLNQRAAVKKSKKAATQLLTELGLIKSTSGSERKKSGNG